MSSCCDKIQDLGCVSACSTITIGATAITGNYVLKWDAGAGPVLSQTINVTAPNDLEYTMDGSILQADYTYIISVVDPNGDEFTIVDGEETYDCWKVKIDRILTV